MYYNKRNSRKDSLDLVREFRLYMDFDILTGPLMDLIQIVCPTYKILMYKCMVLNNLEVSFLLQLLTNSCS